MATNTDKLKQQHGTIFTAKADGKEAFFRKPTRKDLSYALTLRDKPLEMTEVLLKNCFIEGDRCFVEETDYLLGCSALVEQMIEVKNVEVGKL